MRRALFWMFFPLVLPQALRVRRNAPRFPAARGPRSGSVGSGPPLRLLAVGDSIIAGVGAETLDDALVGRLAAELASRLERRVSWRAYGRNGANSEFVVDKLLPRLDDAPADVVVVSIGVNDVTSLQRSRSFATNIGRLVEGLHAHSPAAVIALAGMPPLWGFPLLPQPLRAVFGMRGKTFDEIIERQASRHAGVVHVPLRFEPHPEKFSPDGYHPSSASYREFAGIVADAVEPLVRQSAAR